MSPKAPKENDARHEPAPPAQALEAARSPMANDFGDVVLGDFSICTTWDNKRSVRVAFAGNADLDAREPLTQFLQRLHGEVLSRRASSVICDFGKLYFMNSACFRCFVVWVNEVVSGKIAAQYSVRFLRNPQLPWQTRTLESLRCFGPGVVFIEASS